LKPLELPALPQSVIQKVLSPTTTTPLLEQQSSLPTEPDQKAAAADSASSLAKVHRSATLLEGRSSTSRAEGQGKTTVRRYKSTHELSSSLRHHAENILEQEAKQRIAEIPQGMPPILKASKSTGTKRAGTISRSLEHSIESSRVSRLDEKRAFEKRTLLGAEGQSSPTSPREEGSTLVTLDEGIQFSEGSLLHQATDTSGHRGRSKSISRDNRMARSQSRSRHAAGLDARDQQPSSTSRSKSLRRKPTVRDADRETEAPPPLPTAPGEDGPLLQLDLTPEASHTQSLRNRQVKPLITFWTWYLFYIASQYHFVNSLIKGILIFIHEFLNVKAHTTTSSKDICCWLC
jgi:hypothetical protein